MKRVLVLLFVLCIGAQAKFIPDPIVRYKIDARLDPSAKTVKGREVIVWQNQTNESIPDLQFHLYLNAFKNNYSSFMREGGAESRRVPFRNKADAWGYEQVHSLKVDGQDLTGAMHFIQPDDGNPHDQTVLRVPLPRPIAPKGSVTIEIDWTSKLPWVFARTGFHDNFFLIAQWFPKPGVFEPAGQYRRTFAGELTDPLLARLSAAKGGWNTHQFHMSTEFYADFGTFDVNLTVPSDYEVAATGSERSKKDNGDGTTTYNYYQEDVHDFAWTTQPRSQVMKLVRWFRADEQVKPHELQEWSRRHGLPPEQVKLTDVKVTLFIQREHKDQIDRHFRAVFAGLKWYGLMYGAYPYDVATVVDPPYQGDGAGGMEYPTFFTAGTEYWQSGNGGDPEGVTIHEFGHQYWYGMVASNEFEEAWLDEGLNSYSTTKTEAFEYGRFHNYEKIFGVPVPAVSWLNLPVPRYPWYGIDRIAVGQYWEWVPIDPFRSRARRYLENAQTDAMQRPAWMLLHRPSYGDQAYSKPEQTLHTLEALLGDKWWPAIRTYHQRFRFKHPTAHDFMNTIQEVSGRDLKWFFDQTLYGTGLLNYSVSFSSGPMDERQGFFDQNGNPELAKDGNTDKRPIESEVLVRRLGEMIFPVVVRVKFEDGSEVREQWDGLYRWTKFYYKNKPRIVSAELDPENAWKLEVPRTDNSYLGKPNTLAAEKWYLRWVVWIQNVLSAFSYFA